MKFVEMVKEAKKLEVKSGYEKLKGGEYGIANMQLLAYQGAKPGIYVAVSAIIKSKSFDFKGAKTYMVAKPLIRENAEGKSEMKGWAGYGRVLHIDSIRLLDGSVADCTKIKEIIG